MRQESNTASTLSAKLHSEFHYTADCKSLGDERILNDGVDLAGLLKIYCVNLIICINLI